MGMMTSILHADARPDTAAALVLADRAIQAPRGVSAGRGAAR